MKKTAYCLWVFFALLFVAGSCKKSDDVQPLPVVGAWTLDRIILTELPSPYDQLNSQNLDPLQFFAFRPY
ncbi:hypothetical protein ACFFJX_30250 [Pseudarcicella hirudinis]|uniref:hypothetical protein n=1 Tax=Pseudarcicella hirudinis TaxID=1079859 RepID=UPI0035EF26F7